nr:MAG TPA: hypothetical protein [Caudoviricetes sp.]
MTEYIDKSAAVRILEAKSDMAVCTDALPFLVIDCKERIAQNECTAK